MIKISVLNVNFASGLFLYFLKSQLKQFILFQEKSNFKIVLIEISRGLYNLI